MSMIRALFPALRSLVVSLTVASGGHAMAQPVDHQHLQALIGRMTLTALAKEEVAKRPSCEVDYIAQLSCAVSRDKPDLMTHNDVIRLLQTNLQSIRQEPEHPDAALRYWAAATSALVLFQREAKMASTTADQRDAFRRASQIWDLLQESSIQSKDPTVHAVMIRTYGEAFLIARGLHLPPIEQTVRLTNLANSHARQSRLTTDRTAAANRLKTALAIRLQIVDILERAGDPIRLARALFNLGNGYMQVGELVSRSETSSFIALSAAHYDRSIDILLNDDFVENATANRLLTIAVAMRALSMTRGAGDNYFAHRRAIAMIKYMREFMSQRVSPQREVDLAIAELSLRVQLVSRLAIDSQKLDQVNEALAIFERYAPNAVERRKEADTRLSLGLLATSLYGYRGALTGDADDCRRSAGYWNSVVDQIPLFPGTTGSGRGGDTLLILIDCHVATNPALGAASDPETTRIRHKKRLMARYSEGRPFLKSIPPLFDFEFRREVIAEAGGDFCRAAELLDQRLPQAIIVDTPEFWALKARGLACRRALKEMDLFLETVVAKLIAREESEAGTRSGLALMARRLRQPLTDLAIVLAENDMMARALWLIDFRDRSRARDKVDHARSLIKQAEGRARDTLVTATTEWLRFDNPADLERSYKGRGFHGGEIQLASEVAAQSLDLQTVKEFSPDIQEVHRLAVSLAASRIIAWLLVGTDSSAWIVARSEAGGARFESIHLAFKRSDLTGLLATQFRHSTQKRGLNFFELRDKSYERGDHKLVAQWQTAVSELSTEIGTRIVAPLLDSLAVHPDSSNLDLLTLILRNELADFPIHAIPIPNDSRPCGPSLIDCFLVTYTGELTALVGSVVDRKPKRAVIDTYWGYSDLPELDSRSLSTYGNVLRARRGFKIRTDPNTALDGLAGTAYGLWIVHGDFKPTDPGASVFLLSETERLTPVDIVSRAPLPTGRLLQILIGCDGGLFDTRVQPTEQVGLAEPFFQIGIPNVIVPTWNSELVPSMVFSKILMRELSTEASPAEAYRTATLYLRDSELADIFNLIDPERSWIAKSFVRTILFHRQAEAKSKAQMSRVASVPLFGDLVRYGTFKLIEGGLGRQ